MEHIQQSDDSVDGFWADALCFPKDYKSANHQIYQKALNQIRLGIREGGFGCYRNLPLIDVAQYSAIASTMI